MNPITAAVLKAGLLTPAMLQEMKRISPAVIDHDAESGDTVSLEEAAELVNAALQSEKYVLLRETDLASIRQYLDTMRQGVLHLSGADPEGIQVSYGRNTVGEYIIAWKSESIAELMLDPETYLDTGEHVYFKDVRELFFGEQKAFMVCIPGQVAHGSVG